MEPTTKRTRKIDPGLAALSKIVRMIEEVEPRDRWIIIKYLQSRYTTNLYDATSPKEFDPSADRCKSDNKY